MKRCKLIYPLVVFTFALGSFDLLQAEAEVSGMFVDHMVLQQAIPVPVWGTGTGGENVTVQFAEQKKTTTVGEDGKWMIKLDALTASGESRDLTVTSSGKTSKIQDVLVGEVWLASGQSNMAFNLAQAHNAAEVLPKAGDPQLRFYKVPNIVSRDPLFQVIGKWHLSTPESARGFSAVAYFFARELRESRKCPIGIIQSAWGGSSIQPWMSLDCIKKEPVLQNDLGRWNKALEHSLKVRDNPNLATDYENNLKQWQTEVAPAYNAELKAYRDAGNNGPKPRPSRPEPINPDPLTIPTPGQGPKFPTITYNAMISPVVPYAIRGYLWYQGESNGTEGLAYREQLPRLIEGWREAWKRGLDAASAELSFIVVQLPGWSVDPTPVAEKGWPWVREAQFMTLKFPHTGMAIAIDLGDPKNIHPIGKLDVGHRAALVARKLTYGESIVASGPLYRDYVIEGSEVKINFQETGGGLTIGQTPWKAPGLKPLPTDKLIGFYIAGEDKKWVEANARIDGISVIVSSSQVTKPFAVRYGWANSPSVNLYNKEGLPAAPFRTDDWPEIP